MTVASVPRPQNLRRGRRILALLFALALLVMWSSHALLNRVAPRPAKAHRPLLADLSIQPAPAQAPAPSRRSRSHNSSAPLQADHHLPATTESSVDCELLFGMPTVARGTSGISYLNVTLEALLCQLTDLSASVGVCIAVYEPHGPMAPGQAATPTPFELAKRALADRPVEVRRRVLFVRGSASTKDPAAGSFIATGPGSKLQKTRQQTRDVARMLLALHPLTRAHLVLMEDDWLLCEGAMRAIRYLLAKATLYQPGFAALRFSYGLNGLLLPTADLPPLARFLLDPAAEADNQLPDAPVDHLTYRWLRGKYSSGRSYFGQRRIMAFRHTLFWHIGDASAVGNSKARHRPKCYGLTKEWLFEQESFHVDECPHDDLWPCGPQYAPEAGSTRATALTQLVERFEADSAGAAVRCSGVSRMCWRRPTAATNAESRHQAQCASRLRCGDALARGVNCVPSLPEYAEGG